MERNTLRGEDELRFREKMFKPNGFSGAFH